MTCSRCGKECFAVTENRNANPIMSDCIAVSNCCRGDLVDSIGNTTMDRFISHDCSPIVEESKMKWKELNIRDLNKLYGKVSIRFWQDQVNYEESAWLVSKASRDKIISLINKGVRYQYKEKPLQMSKAFYLYLLENDLHGKLFESNCVSGSRIIGTHDYVEIVEDEE